MFLISFLLFCWEIRHTGASNYLKKFKKLLPDSFWEFLRANFRNMFSNSILRWGTVFNCDSNFVSISSMYRTVTKNSKNKFERIEQKKDYTVPCLKERNCFLFPLHTVQYILQNFVQALYYSVGFYWSILSHFLSWIKKKINSKNANKLS